MGDSLINEGVYKKYILPTKDNKKNLIGIELELPILNLNKEPVNFDVVHELTLQLIKEFNFQSFSTDSDGNIHCGKIASNGDSFSFDYSYNNLEFSMGIEENINTIYKRFFVYYKFCLTFLSKYNHTLTGMGINPYRHYNNNSAIPAERYRMIRDHLESYTNFSTTRKFHSYPDFGSFSCASQVQLDVSEDRLIRVITTFEKLEPIKAILFSNSLLLDEDWDLICSRDKLWDSSMYGYNPNNIGMYATPLKSKDELLDYIGNTSLYNVAREGKYIHFPPITVNEYFNSKYIDGKVFECNRFIPIRFSPILEDLDYLRSYKFQDLTFRGTIEFRSACCQPVKDSMSVAAFHLGLLKRLDEIEALLLNDKVIYNHGYSSSELRKEFIKTALPTFVDRYALKILVINILSIAKSGLHDRGLDEEKFLVPLFKRGENLLNPGKIMLNGLSKGEPLEKYIFEYGQLD